MAFHTDSLLEAITKEDKKYAQILLGNVLQ